MMLSDQINKVLADNKLDASIEMITDSDILHGILKLAKNTDLLVMGGKSGDFIELLFSRSLAREITEQVNCPVLWLKEYEERESFFSSLFKSEKITKTYGKKIQNQFIGFADSLLAFCRI